MSFSANRALALGVLLAGAALHAAPPPLPPGAGARKAPPPTPTSAAADKKPAPAPGAGLDALKLPAEAVLVVWEQAAGALRLAPRGVFLTPEKYQSLLDEIARLRAQLNTPRPEPPSICRLKGKVEGDQVRLEARFDFVSLRPDAVVALACTQATVTSGTLDGRTPLLREGYSAQAGPPGEHHLTLKGAVGLKAQGSSQGFVLDLPRAASTSLELELPGGCKDLRVGDRPWSESAFHKLRGNILEADLGAAPRLEVSWKSAGSAPGNAPVLCAEGQVLVRVAAGQMTTRATLSLKVQGGQTDRWRLLVPPQAELQLAPADEARVKEVQRADQKYVSLRTILLKEPSAVPLTVTVTTHAPAPRPRALSPIGPFSVPDAARQSGEVLVSNLVNDLHLEFLPHGDLAQRALVEEDRRLDPGVVAAFRFGGVPRVDNPHAPTGPASASWLDLDAEIVRGKLRTRLTHVLSLVPEGPEGQRVWQVQTTIEATPRWAEVEELDVRLPPGCEVSEDGVTSDPDRKVRRVEIDRSGTAGALVRIRLARLVQESPFKKFSVTLEGRYTGPVARGNPKSEARNAKQIRNPKSETDLPVADFSAQREEVSLPLPQPQDTADQGGQVTVRVPADLELVPPAAGNPGLELVRQTTHEQQTWRCRRAPARVEVSWQPYRPEVRASGVVDLTLTSREGHIRHELRWPFPQPGPAQVRLRVPPAVRENLRLLRGGTSPEGRRAGTREDAGGTWEVNLAAATGGHQVLVLDYSFPLTERAGTPFEVPLVVPEGVTQGETKVRVWAEPGTVPTLAGNPGPWTPLDIEEVSGHDALPVLVLRAQRVNARLMLRLGEGEPVFTVLVQRALIQATLGEGGSQQYRARFLLARLAVRQLEIELPAPVPTLGLRITLNHKEVEAETVDRGGSGTEGGHVARLQLNPDLVHPGSILEISYQLPPGGLGDLLRTTLRPPLLRGDPGGAPTRWLVLVPPAWLVVAPEGGPGADWIWARRGGLWAPHLTTTVNELERWFAGAGSSAQTSSATEETVVTPGLVCWHGTREPLRVTHVSQHAWLLACSLTLLALWLGLYGLTRPVEGQARLAGWFWPALAVVALAAAVAALLWPRTLALVAYGCEPGLPVLLGLAGAQWLLQERQRRQVVFLPNFARARAGSSLLRAPQRPHGEPSTVDAPHPAGSSASRHEVPSAQEGQDGLEERG